MAKKNLLLCKGIAVYPHLNAPDTKFKAEGKFHVKLRLSAEDAAPTMEKIDALLAESLATAKADEKNAKKKIKQAEPPYSVDDETGDVTFSFSTVASGVSKKDGKPWKRTLAVFDASGVALAKVPNIGGGSLLRVSFEAGMFYTALVGAGVSLRLEAVQVIDLVEWGGGNAQSFGFAAEEGYTAAPAPEFPAEQAEEQDATTEATSDSADF